MLASAEVKTRALALGFDRVGIIPAEPSPFLAQYLAWIDAGMQGEMGYMARPDRVARRRDLSVILPGVQTLIVVARGFGDDLPTAALTDPTRGRIAAYAWGHDYHTLLTPRLEALARDLTGGRAYVDTGAILERGHGWRAGLGFIGKNTMLIAPRGGSSFFLGVILTTEAVDAHDSPLAGADRLPRATMCGRCRRCLDACPTDAFPAPHILDARRCISYLTIEYKGAIPHALRPRFGNWVFGCDVCQEVCPFERFGTPAPDAQLRPISLDRAAPPLDDLLRLDESGFAARFADTPIARIKRARLVRNACIAAGNSGQRDLIVPLAALATDADPLLREASAWAIARLDGDL